MHLPDAAPLSIWPPLLAVAGPGEATSRHRHHNLHLVLARRGMLRAEVGAERREVAGVLTNADVEHAIDGSGRDVVLLFVDPESVPGASLASTLTAGAAWIDRETRAVLLGGLGSHPRSSELEAWGRRAVHQLTGGAWEPPRIHPRVTRLLRYLRASEPGSDTSLDALAERAELSPSRFMHVFTESVGIPVRPYLRWLRFQRAASAVVGGAPLSEAAVAGGFSDAAHMSRTFKEMFGLSPSALQSRSRKATIDR